MQASGKPMLVSSAESMYKYGSRAESISMHIEPGILSPDKIAFANAVAAPLFLGAAAWLIRHPSLIGRTVIAATFFSLLMQAFHLKVGPSELHFVGALPIYLVFGMVPT